jgi:hypothetical protein
MSVEAPFGAIMTKSSLPFHLTPEDLVILSMTDEEYKLLSWEFIKGVIGNYVWDWHCARGSNGLQRRALLPNSPDYPLNCGNIKHGRPGFVKNMAALPTS